MAWKLPSIVDIYYLGIPYLLLVAVIALKFGSKPLRHVLLAFGVIGILAPTVIPASQAQTLKSLVWQGKDGMPLWVGLPILAVGAGAAWWSEHPLACRTLIGVAGIAQFAAFVGAPPLHSGLARTLDDDRQRGGRMVTAVAGAYPCRTLRSRAIHWVAPLLPSIYA